MEEMRLTTQQRIADLERGVTVLRDTLRLLHKMLKEQRELINDYVVQKVTQPGPCTINNSKAQGPNGAHELFAFVCRRKFDKIEHDLVKMRELTENLRFGLRAG